MKIVHIIYSGILLILISCNGTNSQKMNAKNSTADPEQLLFVGTYTKKEGHVDGKANGIYALKFNTDNGSLSTTRMAAEAINPSYISVNHKSQKIYAVSEVASANSTKDGAIQSFEFNEENESITPLNSVKSIGGAPCYIMEHEDHIFSANYVGGNFCVFPILKNGSLASLSQNIQNTGRGMTSRQEAPHGHMIKTNPHDNTVFAVDLGLDKIDIYNFKKRASKLTINETIKLQPGSGPRHIDFHPTKNIIYILNELNGTIDIFQKTKEKYAHLQNISSTYYENNIEAACADIHIHPNGKFLYASNRGPINSVSLFEIKEDGTLRKDSEKSTMGEVPRSFVIDPTGKYLLVANQNSDNIVVFEINPETGRLVEINSQIEAPTPVCLKF